MANSQTQPKNLSASPAAKVVVKTVETDAVDQRLDNYIFSHYRDVPKTRIYKAIRKGEIRINGGRKTFSYRLQTDDKIRLPPLHSSPEKQAPPLKSGLSFKTLFEDKSYWVVDKPENIPVHAGTGHKFGMIDYLSLQCPDEKLMLAHRLDKPVSGCLLIAKNRGSLNATLDAWSHEQAEKIYSSIVFSQKMPGLTRLSDPLAARSSMAERQKSSITDVTQVKTLDAKNSLYKLSLSLKTGRLHQIRKHCAINGMPIIGDDQYGDFDLNQKIFQSTGVKGLMLHCERLTFFHHQSGWITVNSQQPKRFEQLMSKIKPIKNDN